MKPKWKFFWATVRHKWYVFLAGLRVGGIPLWRLVIHDWAKFTPKEFPHYARKFYGDAPVSAQSQAVIERKFATAWLHHENTQPHHWGYWIPRSGRYARTPIPMPETYIREMVADFMGASREYTGSWDMVDWLSSGSYDHVEGNLEKGSAVIFAGILAKIGYGYAGGKWHRFKPLSSQYPSWLSKQLARWLDARC